MMDASVRKSLYLIPQNMPVTGLCFWISCQVSADDYPVCIAGKPSRTAIYFQDGAILIKLSLQFSAFTTYLDEAYFTSSPNCCISEILSISLGMICFSTSLRNNTAAPDCLDAALHLYKPSLTNLPLVYWLLPHHK